MLGPLDTRVSEVVHACHVATIDQGLQALAIPGLDRATLEPVLQYCAGLKCIEDQVTCPGCKRRTEVQGIETLDQFILSKKEVIVGDGRVRLKGEGTETIIDALPRNARQAVVRRELLVLGAPRHPQIAPRHSPRPHAGRSRCRQRARRRRSS